MASFFQKLRAGLQRTREALADGLARVAGREKLDDETLEDLEAALLSADVGVATTGKLLARLKERARSEGSAAGRVREVLAEEIGALLARAAAEPTEGARAEGPRVILVVGVNGTGKTTSIGKLAHRHAREGRKVLVVAADTFRAAAAEQLDIWAARAGVDIVRSAAGADPAAVAFDGVSAAIARNADVVLIDTAGRLQTKTNLMEEVRKIHRVVARRLPGAPHETLLVLDATTGQNALSQAREFGQALGVTGLVLAKVDGTARGGAVLAIADQYEIPVKHLGVGESLDDLVDFEPEAFARALVGE
jgi:fused signal recognition particle receptor